MLAMPSCAARGNFLYARSRAERLLERPSYECFHFLRRHSGILRTNADRRVLDIRHQVDGQP